MTDCSLTSKSESLKSYGMFQPSIRNLRRSMSTEWKKQRQNSSFLYLSGLWQRLNCCSRMRWYMRFMFAFRPCIIHTHTQFFILLRGLTKTHTFLRTWKIPCKKMSRFPEKPIKVLAKKTSSQVWSRAMSPQVRSHKHTIRPCLTHTHIHHHPQIPVTCPNWQLQLSCKFSEVPTSSS